MKKKFEFLDHTADVYIAAYGKTLEEALENAAYAVFETMTETKRIKPRNEDIVYVQGHDEQELLYNWLEALLIKFDVTSNLYVRFEVEEIEKTDSGFRFKARIWGEPYNPKKHLTKVGIKAVTYHQMEILKKTGRVDLKFILDI